MLKVTHTPRSKAETSTFRLQNLCPSASSYSLSGMMENDDDEEDDDVAKEGKEARYLEASGYLHCQSYCHRSLQLKI